MKERLDLKIAKLGNISRSKAQSLIEKGRVKVNGEIVLKPAMLCTEEDKIWVSDEKQYVSRGAYKLLGAIEKFGVDFNGLVVLDMGASTGGFTQVALEHGAKKVYAVDIGLNELDPTLAKDPRVINMPGRDIRQLKKEEVADCQIVIGDLSFISLRHILPKIKEILGNLPLILLFKPQFECGKEIARKFKGVIKDEKVHEKLLKDFVNQLCLYGYKLTDMTPSPIKGKEGNIEYLLYINGR